MKNYFLICPLLAVLAMPTDLAAANNTVVGWNNLGMHCMDSDYSVFSILPPYNTIHAQLIIGGKLVTNQAGYKVTYEAIADPDGSFNSTSRGKGNFYQFSQVLYGGAPPVDMGLAGFGMPGTNNLPQAFTFDAPFNWFRAEGIPITPYDDARRKNPYPLMRLVARDASSNVIATSDIVLPVSDEMDCRACHASGSLVRCRPDTSGWVWNSNPELDYRLNILRDHDDMSDPATYPAVLAQAGYNPAGLYRTVAVDGKPILCAKCHLSEALPGTGLPGVLPLTAAMHGRHAMAPDPITDIALGDSANRAACYRCHPGSTTRCLRGVMGNSIAADGSMAIQCQSCHGSMSVVGSTNRIGWLQEPNCQSCHSGTATLNSGQIRYTSSFETNGSPRIAADQTFATTPNAPAAGLSLFRFSTGHGGVKCEGCHGSTHAEFPSAHRNDNLRNLQLQGHAGVLAECTACHTTTPNTVNGGPHGMHPVGQSWVGMHPNAVNLYGTLPCQNCHGTDYRGTVLSRLQADRVLTAAFDLTVVTTTAFRGAQIGCYSCHNGPQSKTPNPSAPPAVTSVATNTLSAQPVAFTLPASGSGSVEVRIISQPANGTVGISNQVATYFPYPEFVGNDSFTFAAWDGMKNSSLGTGTIAVAQGPFSISAITHVPDAYPLGWAAPFAVIPTPSNALGGVAFQWNFGDGSPLATNQFPTHVYTNLGSFDWSVVCTLQAGAATATCTNAGTVLITAPATVQAAISTNQLIFTWPRFAGEALLEWTTSLGPAAHWVLDTNAVLLSDDQATVVTDLGEGTRIYRLRKQ